MTPETRWTRRSRMWLVFLRRRRAELLALCLVVSAAACDRKRDDPSPVPPQASTGAAFTFNGVLRDFVVGEYGMVRVVEAAGAERVLLLSDGLLIPGSDFALSPPMIAAGGGSAFWRRAVDHGDKDTVLMTVPLPGRPRTSGTAARILTRICAKHPQAGVDADEVEAFWACDGVVGAIPVSGGDRREVTQYASLAKPEMTLYVQHMRVTPAFVYIVAQLFPSSGGKPSEVILARAPKRGGELQILERHETPAIVYGLDASDTTAYLAEAGPSVPGPGHVLIVGPGVTRTASGQVVSNPALSGDSVYWTELTTAGVTLFKAKAGGSDGAKQVVLEWRGGTSAVPMFVRAFRSKLYVGDAHGIREHAL